MIENIQRRGTKLVPELININYTDRLKMLNLPTLKSSSSSYKVQTPSGVYSYWRSAVQELSTVDLKICQSVCTVQLKTSSTFYRMMTGRTSLLKLSMVGQLTTDWGRLFQSRMVSGKKDLW